MSDPAAASPQAWGVLPAVTVVLLTAAALGYVFAAADAGVVQRRPGPVSKPVRATVRLLVQQRRTTRTPDWLLWRLGCVVVPVVAVLAAAIVPLAGHTLLSTSADLVWFNAMEALLWAAVWLVGWGPNSVYPLVGGYRFVAQGLAYELPLMFALITAGLAAGSLRMSDIVAAQENLWFVVTMPAAFVVFVVGAMAFAFWGPFGTPVSPDVADGVLAELSSADRLVVEAGRRVFLGVSAAVAAVLFLGGDRGPWLPGPVWQLVKTCAVIGIMVVLGRRLPLLRPDRVVEVAWMVLVPAMVAQIAVVGVLVLAGAYR